MKEAAVYFTESSEAAAQKGMHHLAGEALLAYGLQREYGIDLRHERRERGKHGKPYLVRRPGIHYNISHSGKYVVCGFAPEELGIDVQEHRRADYSRLLTRMMPEEAAEAVRSAADPVREFYHEWVKREAYLKWTGEGLTRSLRGLSMEDGHICRVPLPDSGYSAALCSRNPMKIRLIAVPFLDIPIDSL